MPFFEPPQEPYLLRADFSSDSESLRRAALHFASRLSGFRHTRVTIVVLLLMTIASGAAAAALRERTGVGLATVAAVVLVVVFRAYSPRRMADALVASYQGTEGRRAVATYGVRASRSAYFCFGDASCEVRRWSAIQSISQNDDAIFVFIQPIQASIIPRDADFHGETFASFGERLRELHDRSRAESPGAGTASMS